MSDEGVKYCVALMTSGKWVTGRSGEHVAKTFGVSKETVKEWATSASRIIRLCLEEDGTRDDIRARMVATLDRVVSLAMKGKKAVTFRDGVGKDTETRTEIWDAPELGAVVSAIAEQTKLLGLAAPQQHKVDLTVHQYEQLTPEAMRAKLLEQRAKIDEALAKLDQEERKPMTVTGDLSVGEIKTVLACPGCEGNGMHSCAPVASYWSGEPPMFLQGERGPIEVIPEGKGDPLRLAGHVLCVCPPSIDNEHLPACPVWKKP